MTPLGLYVHWPYCARICPYCDFNVYKARTETDGLVRALLADLERWRERLGRRPLHSIHFGGGTPSLMDPADVARLIERADALFGCEAGVEIGLEANPAERARFADFRQAGIERFSIGLQALDDACLAALGRDHDAAAGIEAVETAAKTGARVSLDLIYARENQTLRGWIAELDQALRLPAGHLSLYQLTIEPSTAFAKRVERGELTPPDDAAAADLYRATGEIAAAAGAPAYEISNHARSEADRSRHNRLYWTGGDWIGIGPGAHSRVGDAASGGRLAAEAPARPDIYAAGASGHAGWTQACLTPLEEAQERILMGLRVSEGLDRAALRAATGRDIDESGLASMTGYGVLALEGDRVRLTPAGRAFADAAASALCPTD